MSLKVVTFSTTKLAGAPIRIARAIDQHTEASVRHVDLARWGIFDHDHVHAEDPEKTLALAEEADVLHLFNGIDADSKMFAPVDFAALQRKGKRLIRMFESTPMLVAQQMKCRVEDVLSDSIPKLVIAQYPERFFPTARVVPNIIPQNDPTYCPRLDDPQRWGVVYSPSWPRSAWDARWDTKGMPETIAVLKKVAARTGRPNRIVHRRPLSDVMAAKREAAIIADEMVTGSYHLSALEGLSLGKPVVAYLDDRVKAVLAFVTGASECPFVNTRLEDAECVLVNLLNSLELCQEVGQASRNWVERYYNDSRLAQIYVDIYRDLMEDPSRVRRQSELALDTPARRFFALDHPDSLYEARRSRWLGGESLKERGGRVVRNILTPVRERLCPIKRKIKRALG